MVGNELFFAELHRSFVALLQCLGRQFGGVIVEPPVSDQELRESYYESQDDDDEQIAKEVQMAQRVPSAPKALSVAS